VIPAVVHLLSRFRGLCVPTHSGEAPPCDWSAVFDAGRHDRHLVVGCLIHGNETGSLPAAVRVLQGLRSGALRYGGRFTVFIGNPAAVMEGCRFIEADLNRVFGVPGATAEHRRAAELTPILDTADLFIDLHQTIMPTVQPFYIFAWCRRSGRWARALGGAEVWVTRPPGASFSSGTCCSDEYVRSQGRAAITLELGAQGLHPRAETLAYGVITRALAFLDDPSGPPDWDACPPLQRLHTAHAEPFVSAELVLRPGLTNFQVVCEGERLSADGTPSLHAPCDGALLFPKYPRREDGRYVGPLPREIYRIVRELPADTEWAR